MAFNWATATDEEVRNHLVYGNVEGTGAGNYGHYTQQDIDNTRQFNQYSPEVQSTFNPYDDTYQSFFEKNPLDQGRYVEPVWSDSFDWNTPTPAAQPAIDQSSIRPLLERNPDTGGMSRFTPMPSLTPGGEMYSSSLGPGSIIEKTPKNPDFEGIDMSGFVPPRMQTMDVQTFTLNGEERTGSGSYISALEDYLNSTGQGDVLSRGDNRFLSTNVDEPVFGPPTTDSKAGMKHIEDDNVFSGKLGVEPRGPMIPEQGELTPYVEPPIDFNMTPAVEPTEPTNPFADIPVWSGDTPNAPWNQQPEFTQTPYQQPMLTGDSGIANLAYSGSQLGAPQQKGLARQNLDYAMAQLGMMTGGTGTGDTGTGGISTPGFDAPWGGATPDGGYTNPFTGTDSAGRTPDDPYYGGLSDVGTADPNNWTYGNVNDYYNWGGDVLGGLFGPIAGAFGDAAFGINPVPGAGNYIPGTDTYIPSYLENFEGAGEKITDLYGIGTGEQRDMLIDQGFLGGEGMLGNKIADPDQQFFETKAEALNWYNNGVPVANPEDPGTAEAVGVANDMLSLQGSSFGSQAEAQAVANHGFGSDEHMAALEADDNQVAIDLLTPSKAPVATAPEAPTTPTPTETISVHPETRLPTKPTPGVDGYTDPATGQTFYNEDHNWNNPSQGPVEPNQTPIEVPASSVDTGGWGDTDTSEGTTAGDYQEAGFSQEDTDFATSFDDDSDDDDDDGGWGDWGGGDNFGFE